MPPSRARLRVLILSAALLSCATSDVAPTPTPSIAPSGAASPSPSVSASDRPTSPPSASSTNSGFYTQVVYVAGFAVKGSAKVRPEALSAAADAFGKLVFGNATVVNRMRDAHLSVAVIAESERLTDLPEYARFRGAALPDGRLYDAMRAIGPSPCVAGEENLLHLPTDTFDGANILVHECAHAVYLYGLDRAAQARWNEIYAQSIAAGLWFGTYAATSATEFFAELTESYFGVNAPPESGVHNDVNSAADLDAYDPRAFAFLASVYTPVGSP